MEILNLDQKDFRDFQKEFYFVHSFEVLQKTKGM